MKAVHFGAGNIGRGFVGLVLHEAGYEVVFADVSAELIGALQKADSYLVREVGAGARDHRVDGFRAVDSRTNVQDVVSEIATADIVTTAVGPNVLRFVAPAIAEGLRLRDEALPPLGVMACENAIDATDLLLAEIEQVIPDAEREVVLARGVFANTAVDRIVPAQDQGTLDVTVESYFEWVIDRTPFHGHEPDIPGATFVDDLSPYIERKLFTVNTGHATIAYFGFLAGAWAISDALALPFVDAAVRAVLEETRQLLVAKHGIDERKQQDYIDRILVRFANPHLPDTVDRVGRQPLRKLGRHERFIGPAAELAERGATPSALLDAVGAALRFDVPADEQSVQLRSDLAAKPAEEFAREVYGLEDGHPLFGGLVAVTRQAKDLG
ncbi:MAG TPA: mannitol-1-phosphate 5-dehydrogenase [Terrimesophilobacter sp.]|nr:mannitol-1-phosphate 5-dehydrogenase [Terrimesophilobacter sp.]